MNKDKLNAEIYSIWLSNIRESIQNNTAMEVPCGDCQACCTSSLFIHIKKEEAQTIDNVNKRLLFDAPNFPKGNYLLGYLPNGHCPMYKENQCSIYTNRPNTCKNFDCRIFVATGLKADNYLKKEISNQSKRWKFSFPTEIDKIEFIAVGKAVNFIKENKELFPEKRIPTQNSELAILAIKVYKVFIEKIPNQNNIEVKKMIVNEIVKELKHYDSVN